MSPPGQTATEAVWTRGSGRRLSGVDPADELVDIVDLDDLVVGIATRAEMRSQNLRHRCAEIAVMNGAGPENGSWGFTYGHPMFWAPFSLVGEGGAQ